MYVINTGKDVNTFAVKQIKPDESEVLLKHQAKKGCMGATRMIWSQIRPLFKVPYIFYLGNTCFMQFSTYLTSGGMGVWFTHLSNKISQSSATGTLCDILRDGDKDLISSANQTAEICVDTVSDKAFYDSILIGFYYTVVLSLIAVLVQRLGRGYILMVMFFGGSAAGYSLYWVTNPNVAIALFSMMLVFSGSSLPLISGSSINLFPTSIRTMAICLMMMTGRIGTSLGSSFIGSLIQSHCEETFFTVTTIVLGEFHL